MADEAATCDVSIVVPAYNEEEVLPEFHKRLMAVLDALSDSCEVIYVNDGSTDGTLALLRSLHEADPRIIIVDLSRNFGKEIALTAGLDHSSGHATIPIDADLQDPPELVPTLIEKWREGYDVVYAKRLSRDGESWLKRASASAFYGLMQRLGSKVKIPADTGDFRLLNRKALTALGQMREHHRFMKGLFATIGFRQTSVDYSRDPRFAGETKWNYWALWNFSLEGITAFTIAPLKIATYVGLASALMAFVYGIFIVIKTILYGDPVAGFPSLMVMVAGLGGIQLVVLGIIGEYLGRIFNETKQRPLYFIQDVYGLKTRDTSDES